MIYRNEERVKKTFVVYTTLNLSYSSNLSNPEMGVNEDK